MLDPTQRHEPRKTCCSVTTIGGFSKRSALVQLAVAMHLPDFAEDRVVIERTTRLPAPRRTNRVLTGERRVIYPTSLDA